jgi:putative transposase
MYSEEEHRKTLKVYEETKSATKTITILGYPARRQTLYNWINRKRMLPEDRAPFVDIIHRSTLSMHCFELGEDVQLVLHEVGYSTASIYNWRHKAVNISRKVLRHS